MKLFEEVEYDVGRDELTVRGISPSLFPYEIHISGAKAAVWHKHLTLPKYNLRSNKRGWVALRSKTKNDQKLELQVIDAPPPSAPGGLRR